ncbi:MAG: extracellular solute-binding protein, partial [Oscillospiraceae bacterium]
MLKKICSLTLVVIMSLTLLAGCGSKESAKNGKDEPYQIDWYFIGDPQPNVKEIEEEANKYLKGKINATLKINSLDWGSYASRLNVMIAGNEKFDICFTDSSNYKSNASRQAYLPLNELIDKYAPKTKEMLGEDFLKGSQINNVNYALPANKDRGHSYGVVYRKDIADKYGLTEKMKSIKSFADLKPILAFIKEKEPDLIPLTHESGNAMTMLLDFEELAYPAGFVGGSTDGKVVNLVETPEFLEAIKITHQNYVDGF